MNRLLLTLLLLPGLAAAAQTGHFTITGDVGVAQMVDKHIELNSKIKTIPGSRVQIASFSGVNSKVNAFNLRDKFMLENPDVQAYIVFDEPNFKVKVGDFRTRLEAYAYLQQIKETYKGYIVRDNIYPEPPQQAEYAPDDEESGDGTSTDE